MIQKAHNGASREIPLVMSAIRARTDVVALLSVITVAGWWWSVTQMGGMDNGPWTALGSLGWFLLMWVVMMAAMMLPSASPTIALYAWMTRKRSPLLSLLFTAGYLLTWAVAGLFVYALSAVTASVTGSSLTWNWIGRGLAGATLIAAAAYQVTSIKSICLEKCRSPFAQLQSTWRDGWHGSIWMGVVNGGWCLGCCWAMMATLFALGIMNLTCMAVLAVLMTAEKLLPWRKVSVYGTAAILLILGVLILVAPGVIPGFTLPSESMTMMHHMG